MKASLEEYTIKVGLKIICFFLVLSAILYGVLWPAGVSINAASVHLQRSSNATRFANKGLQFALKASSIRDKTLKTSVLKNNVDIALKKASSDTEENVAMDTTNMMKDDFDSALKSASMENKTLIIAVLNKAYVGQNGMLELFLQSMREGDETKHLIKHLLLVSVDEIAFDHCKSLGLNCYQLVTEGVSFSKEVFYMSQDFIKMMWRRTQFLGDVLRRGYSFIFTDLDMLWLRNPLTMLGGDEDLQISCDNNFNRSSGFNFRLINTGFYMVKANEKTVALFDKWYAAKNNSATMKDQDVLLKMEIDGVFEQMQMKVKYLDTTHFSGFCQKSKDFTKVVTMHANCCITTAAKIIDLRDFFQDWKMNNGTSNAHWPRHRGCLLLNNIKESA